MALATPGAARDARSEPNLSTEDTMPSSTNQRQRSSVRRALLVSFHGIIPSAKSASVTRFVHDGAYVSLEVYRLRQHARLPRRVLVGDNRHSHLEGHLADVSQVRIDTGGVQPILQQGKTGGSELPKRFDERARQARWTCGDRLYDVMDVGGST